MTELTVSQLIDEERLQCRSARPRLGGGWWVVEPSGPRATYRVSLFASGEGAGDMVADLLWTTQKEMARTPPAHLRRQVNR